MNEVSLPPGASVEGSGKTAAVNMGDGYWIRIQYDSFVLLDADSNRVVTPEMIQAADYLRAWIQEKVDDARTLAVGADVSPIFRSEPYAIDPVGQVDRLANYLNEIDGADPSKPAVDQMIDLLDGYREVVRALVGERQIAIEEDIRAAKPDATKAVDAVRGLLFGREEETCDTGPESNKRDALSVVRSDEDPDTAAYAREALQIAEEHEGKREEQEEHDREWSKEFDPDGEAEAAFDAAPGPDADPLPKGSTWDEYGFVVTANGHRYGWITDPRGEPAFAVPGVGVGGSHIDAMVCAFNSRRPGALVWPESSGSGEVASGWPAVECSVVSSDGETSTMRVTCRHGDTTKAARANGWVPGTVLVGDEGYGLDAIRVDHIGRRILIASHLAFRRGLIWESADERESEWTLSCRDWRRATPEELADIDSARGSRP